MQEMLDAIVAEATQYLDAEGRVHLDWQIAVLEATRP